MFSPALNPLAAIPFVHPALAGAAGAVALIPLIIHLINRRRYKRVRWAAMGFLLAANQKSLRRIRLENWLLLLVRTVVIAALALAVARPYLSDGMLLGLGDTTKHRILLIDNSLSASARDGRQTQSSSGSGTVAAALELLADFPRGDAVSVITLAHPAQAMLDHAAYDRRLIRQQVARIQPTQRATDLAGGLTAALGILADSPSAPENRVIYLISDQAASAWQVGGTESQGAPHPAVLAARKVADAAQLVLVPVAGPDRDNLAITEVRSIEGLPGVGQPIRVTATVANFGRHPVRGATIQARRGDRIDRRVALELLEPGASQTVTFSIQADRAGPVGLQLRLDAPMPDALPADDVRSCSLEVFDTVPILLVDGRPGPGKFEGETGYLSTAFSPVVQTGETSLLDPKTITELELSGEVLADYRLIVLCNVQRLDESVWERLTEFVTDGGGLLIYTGEALNAENYNRFGYAAGQGVLPGKLGPPVGDADNHDTFVRLAGDAFTHPALADFSDVEQSGLFLKGRIYRLTPLEVDSGLTNVVLRYSNAMPAIAERTLGRGKCCVITTTANMAWNNLAARGDYVSLLWSLTAYLAPEASQERNLLIGQYITQTLTAGQAGRPLRVITPSGHTQDAALEVEDSHYRLRFGPVEQPGFFTVAPGPAHTLHAVNIDPTESDLRVLDESALRDLLDCDFVYVADWSRVQQARLAGASAEISELLLYAVLLLLVIEGWMAMRIAKQH